MNMHLSQVEAAVRGKLRPPTAADAVVTSAEIDTRRLQPRGLFFALPGTQADGHSYVPAAAAAGAHAAVVRAPQPGDLPQIVVEDAVHALHALAADWRRQQAQVRITAITGSNGKTSVKQLLHSICTAAVGADAVLSSSGNFNNHLGVPLTLLKLRATHHLAVLEAGMDHAGELTALSHLIAPQVAVINNAQRAHLGNFDSVHAIAQAKGELLIGLAADGTAVLNADDAHYPLWRDLAQGKRVLSFGCSASAEVRGEWTPRGIRINGGEDIPLALPGVHNKMNALAAAAAAQALALPADAVAAGLAACTGVPGRLAVQQLAPNITLIDDSYNANPESAAAALAVLVETADAQDADAVLMMGDMLALGDAAASAHEELVSACKDAGVALLGAGEEMYRAMRAVHYGIHLPDAEAAEAAVAHMENNGSKKTCVLVKGSRGMHMERAVHALTQKFATGEA